MEDYILKKLFEPERWEEAIEKGVEKDIQRAELIRLCDPDYRVMIMQRIASGTYKIAPPHAALIPKETPGEFREVMINEPMDRVLLRIIEGMLFELTSERIHKNCVSYLKGIGCGRIVNEIKDEIEHSETEEIGFKSDLSKYFDSVPIEYIDGAFNYVEFLYGKSSVIDLLRDYYHNDMYFDEDGKIQYMYKSLKQGCAVAAWLADVILYDLDEKLSSLNMRYLRYCDDMIGIGPDWKKGLEMLKEELDKMQMKLNPKKVEVLTKNKRFKFLGYSIRRGEVTFWKKHLKTLQKEVEKATIKQRGITLKKAINNLNRFFYKGRYSWASMNLKYITSTQDLHRVDEFILDCLRAVSTGKSDVGGLGYDPYGNGGVVVRGKGKNVRANRSKTPQKIEGWKTLTCMKRVLRIKRALYDSMVAAM